MRSITSPHLTNSIQLKVHSSAGDWSSAQQRTVHTIKFLLFYLSKTELFSFLTSSHLYNIHIYYIFLYKIDYFYWLTSRLKFIFFSRIRKRRRFCSPLWIKSRHLFYPSFALSNIKTISPTTLVSRVRTWNFGKKSIINSTVEILRLYFRRQFIRKKWGERKEWKYADTMKAF